MEWVGESGGVVIVKNNDLYYKGDPVKGDIVRITDTGIKGIIFNGVPDWTYKGLDVWLGN